MTMMGWIVLGVIAGVLAKLVMPGKDPGGVLVTMLLGIVGAFVGGLLGNWLLGAGIERFWALSSWLLAIAGSVIVLAVYRTIVGRKEVKN
jgi:uncharacterized membrane protein YeaQ/YmgE (transglycosylase-associated protein family)